MADRLFDDVDRQKQFAPGGGFNQHQRSRTGHTNVWLTPRFVIEALSPFDLDPCAADPRPWDCARFNYTEVMDGLTLPWSGRVWLNPPYGPHTKDWLARLAAHGDGVALVFARTDTEWLQTAIAASTGQLWLTGRLRFLRANGSNPPATSGAPSVMLAYGVAAWNDLRQSRLLGVRTRARL